MIGGVSLRCVCCFGFIWLGVKTGQLSDEGVVKGLAYLPCKEPRSPDKIGDHESKDGQGECWNCREKKFIKSGEFCCFFCLQEQ